ncbi:type II CRISPR-associated endonuclease Cas1 [Roseivirga echinicomitans]
MIKRTLFFSNPCYLSMQLKQLVVDLRADGIKKFIPLEDVGFIILEHPQITITSGAIQEMATNNIAVIFCDSHYMPNSMLFHLDTHFVQHERFQNQVNASVPLKKQLWQQTTKAKILNQSAVLEMFEKDGMALKQMAKDVLSGDSTGREAKAAKVYWNRLFGDEFRRERFGDWPNPLLNYGYAILRAATARALSATGLLNTLGIHHRNKYNSFCLADDIMEPYRPWVDKEVFRIYGMDEFPELNKNHKALLLGVLTHDTRIENETSPLMIALQRTAQSLSQCFEGTRKIILYPGLP